MLKVGDVFLDRFEIQALLGKGGFASVFKARQRKLGRTVAIKVLRLGDDLARKRFEQEARLISRLRDPAIVTMHDFGNADGLYYMVLEFVEGSTLRDIIDRDGALGTRRTVDVLQQIVASLVEAHDLGILHRDIKPDNIMLFDHYDRKDCVKVLDFGIAKLLTSSLTLTDVGPVTMSGQAVGTPRYMAPEMLLGRPYSDASDMFSLGLVAYEMLMGERAVKSTDSLVVVERMVDSNPIVIPPGADVPAELAELVNRMLVKDESARLGTARGVAEALRRMDGFGPQTAVVEPGQLAELKVSSGSFAMASAVDDPDIDDSAATIVDAVVARPVTPRLDVGPFEDEADATPADVHAALANLRADAKARMKSGEPTRLAPESEPQSDPEPEPEPEPQPAPKPQPVRVPRTQPADPTPPEVDFDAARSHPRRQRVGEAPAWRQWIGFGILAMAVVFAAGYFLGFVGVEADIHNGGALDCGWMRTSIVTDRYFKVFGVRVVKLGEEMRCSNN